MAYVESAQELVHAIFTSMARFTEHVIYIKIYAQPQNWISGKGQKTYWGQLGITEKKKRKLELNKYLIAKNTVSYEKHPEFLYIAAANAAHLS